MKKFLTFSRKRGNVALSTTKTHNTMSRFPVDQSLPYTSVFDAASNGSYYALDKLIREGGDVNAYETVPEEYDAYRDWGVRSTYVRGRTALMAAVARNFYNCAKLLLEKGADPNLRVSPSSGYVEHSAWEVAKAHADEKMIALLEEHGATPSSREIRYSGPELTEAQKRWGEQYSKYQTIRYSAEQKAEFIRLCRVNDRHYYAKMLYEHFSYDRQRQDLYVGLMIGISEIYGKNFGDLLIYPDLVRDNALSEVDYRLLVSFENGDAAYTGYLSNLTHGLSQFAYILRTCGAYKKGITESKVIPLLKKLLRADLYELFEDLEQKILEVVAGTMQPDDFYFFRNHVWREVDARLEAEHKETLKGFDIFALKEGAKAFDKAHEQHKRMYHEFGNMGFISPDTEYRLKFTEPRKYSGQHIDFLKEEKK